MPWKATGPADGAKQVNKDWHLGQGGTEPHLRDQPLGGPPVDAAILGGLDAHAPEPRGARSGRDGGAAGMAAARRTGHFSFAPTGIDADT